MPSDGISDEIGRDFMRLNETFASATKLRTAAAETNASQPIAFASQPSASSVTLRKSLGNPVQKSGLRIAVSRVGIEPNFSRMLLSKDEIVANLEWGICKANAPN